MSTIRTLAALALAAILLHGCGKGDSLPDDARTRAADQQVRAKWGKPLADLPTDTLVAISPHNENIRNEYQWAFSLHHAVQYGRRVDIEWRSVGGGTNTIVTYLRSVYGAGDGNSGIDILWGGGDFAFTSLAKQGILQPLTLPGDVLQNVPAALGAVRMYDANLYWVGSAVSAFGYVYNATMLSRCRIAPPDGTWDDLGDRRFADLVSVADPTQSGSAAAAYQMIARSGETWPDGWGKLLRILANAKRFTDSAGTSASAPSLGEALVATCIDFYGALRVEEAPGQIVYVSPRGQTAFSPDPIGILKNPPHAELAQRFVDFVMSAPGQALWGLRVGLPDGPARSALGRQPIRKDVYETYKGQFLDSIVNPYQAGQSMSLEGFRGKIDYDVLKYLVGAAAVDNVADLRAARDALAKAGSPPDLLAEFRRLPANVDTVEKMGAIAKDLKDETKRDEIVSGWQTFFRDKYRGIAKGR